MKLTKVILLMVLASLVGIAGAQDGGGGNGGDGGNGGNNGDEGDGGSSANKLVRSFRYYSFDTVNADFSKSGNLTLTSKTTVNVNTFLYISGNMSANWVVRGWGVGLDTETNSIKFYHNGTLSFAFANFDDPQKVTGTKTGLQTVGVQSRLKFYNDTKQTLLYDTSQVPIKSLNGMFSASGPHFDVAKTGGVMRLDFSRTLSITPDVGPGNYQNVGTITVTRN